MGAGHLGLYRLETQVSSGNGTLKTSGLGSSSAAKEAIKVGFDYFKANAHRVSASIKPGDHDYHLHIVELHNTGPTNAMTLAAFVAFCSAVFGKPLQQQLVVLGSMSLGGNVIPVENLAESLQVAFDAGAKRLLLPMASVKDIPTIPGELFAKFQTGFYADPVDAVFKAWASSELAESRCPLMFALLLTCVLLTDPSNLEGKLVRIADGDTITRWLRAVRAVSRFSRRALW